MFSPMDEAYPHCGDFFRQYFYIILPTSTATTNLAHALTTAPPPSPVYLLPLIIPARLVCITKHERIHPLTWKAQSNVSIHLQQSIGEGDVHLRHSPTSTDIRFVYKNQEKEAETGMPAAPFKLLSSSSCPITNRIVHIVDT